MKDRDISRDRLFLGDLAPVLLRWAMAAAVLGFGGAAVLLATGRGGVDRFLQGYLVGWTFFFSLSVGALFFVLLQHVTRAGWSVVVRRLAEGMAALFPVLAILVVPILVGLPRLYEWARPGGLGHAGGPAGKAAYLSPTFFTIRVIAYLAILAALGLYYLKTSLRQDGTGDPALTLRMERAAAPCMVVFALVVNFAAFDLLMSLDPHWYSTIFGVYLFSSSVVGFFAVLPHIVHWLQHHRELLHTVTREHFHDMGKLLFAFVVFWAYIAFSQYLLIWYGNLPEETGWFLKRQTGGWGWVSLLLVVGHFVIPFLVLISRDAKRQPHVLLLASAWVAVMHWVDIYWLVMPEMNGGALRPSAMDVLVTVGIAGLYVAAWVLRMRKHSLVPERDPRLAESLAFENA